jgi:hypothetical protein
VGPNPTEPANYRGSNTTVSREIVDIEIAMYQSAGIITGTITIEPVATVATTMQVLFLKPGYPRKRRFEN